MTSDVLASGRVIRDPFADHLMTQNSAMVLIDYQPSQIAAVRSMDHVRSYRWATAGVSPGIHS
jgi:hypothetical protein